MVLQWRGLECFWQYLFGKTNEKMIQVGKNAADTYSATQLQVAQVTLTLAYVDSRTPPPLCRNR